MRHRRTGFAIVKTGRQLSGRSSYNACRGRPEGLDLHHWLLRSRPGVTARKPPGFKSWLASLAKNPAILIGRGNSGTSHAGHKVPPMPKRLCMP